MSPWGWICRFLGVGPADAAPVACDYPPLRLWHDRAIPGDYRVTNLVVDVTKYMRPCVLSGDEDRHIRAPSVTLRAEPAVALPDGLAGFLAAPPPEGYAVDRVRSGVVFDLEGPRAAVLDLLALLGDVRGVARNELSLAPFAEEFRRVDATPRPWRLTLSGVLVVGYGLLSPRADGRILVAGIRLDVAHVTVSDYSVPALSAV